LRKENAYWESTHATTFQIGGTSFKVNQYRANTTTARPESFREDSATVANITDLSEKKRVLQCLSSMAESGWDFSSRWLDNSSLSSTVIDKIIPSDLNALLALQEDYLATLSSKLGYG
jgi:alpha,alpha-trehalase